MEETGMLNDSPEEILSFLQERNVITLHKEKITFSPSFIKNVIIPSSLDLDTVLYDSFIFMHLSVSSEPISSSDLEKHFAIITSLLEKYGVEDVQAQQDLFAS
jgi:hypothetical protein